MSHIENVGVINRCINTASVFCLVFVSFEVAAKSRCLATVDRPPHAHPSPPSAMFCRLWQVIAYSPTSMPCTAVCLAGYQVITGVMRSGFTIPLDRRLSVCPPPWRTNFMFGLSHCLSHRRVVIIIARRVFILTCESYERTLVMA